MIFPAMDAIRFEMSAAGINVEMGNVSEIVSAAGTNHGTNADIILSLVNIEENRLSRDPLNYLKKDSNLFFKNPPVHLSLTLLFAAVKHDAGYGMALQNIQQVIGFFQGKFYFDQSNTPSLPTGIEKLVLELVSFNIEQLHQLWSMMGGKYHPSVAYKMNMVTIDSVTDQGGEMIKEIEANYYRK